MLNLPAFKYLTPYAQIGKQPVIFRKPAPNRPVSATRNPITCSASSGCRFTRALLRRPQLLILDEVTSALDADNHRLMLDAICTLHGNMTVLIVTHRHEEFAGLIDGVVRVEQGIVGEWQPVARLKQSSPEHIAER